MTEHAGRLIVHDREMHLEPHVDVTLGVGDTVEVIRGNGPREGEREGERMGTATVPAVEDGSPVLAVHFDGQLDV